MTSRKDLDSKAVLYTIYRVKIFTNKADYLRLMNPTDASVSSLTCSPSEFGDQTLVRDPLSSENTVYTNITCKFVYQYDEVNKNHAEPILVLINCKL